MNHTQQMLVLVGLLCGSGVGLEGRVPNLSFIYNLLTEVNKEAESTIDFVLPGKSGKAMSGASVGGELSNHVRPLKHAGDVGKDLPEEKVAFGDIVGLDDALVEVRELTDSLKNKDKFNAMGAKIPKGILLEGPPGNGKTMIARAMACEANCLFFYASASEFVEVYVGQGAKHVRELFAKARRQCEEKKQAAIIFIDEFDAIAAVDRGNHRGGGSEYAQTLNELLVQLDGFESTSKIMVLAATNYASALDKAVVRAGRFDRIVKISSPNKEARLKILKHYLSKKPRVAAGLDAVLERIALATDGVCAADLANLINEAAIFAVRSNASQIEERHVQLAFEKVCVQRLGGRGGGFDELFGEKK